MIDFSKKKILVGGGMVHLMPRQGKAVPCKEMLHPAKPKQQRSGH